MKKSIFLILFLSMIQISCEKLSDQELHERRVSNFEDITPPGSTNIVPINDDWCYFDFDGRKFLMYHDDEDGEGYSALTEITPDKNEFKLDIPFQEEETEEKDPNKEWYD